MDAAALTSRESTTGPGRRPRKTAAGWGSGLMALKGVMDYGVDLRNHEPMRTWDQGYVDS
jgi:hypothetical protein